MSTTRSESRNCVALAALLLVGALLTGCSVLGADDDPAPAPTASAAPEDVVAALTHTLHARAAAVRHEDFARFMSGVARDRRPFARDQRTYFDNLIQLPLARFAYSFDPREMVRSGDDYWVVVDVHLQLEGYDDLPVVTPDRYRFTPVAGRPGAFRLASVTDAGWEGRNDVHEQPWDSGPIEVRTAPGVLGIFDAGSSHAATGLLSSVSRGIADVAGVVPYDWSRTVVVYALSDETFLSSLDDLPGEDPDSVDGVAFPVASTPDGGALAATRFVLNPRMLDDPGVDRDRLIRHELTHVALGTRDDRAPVWLAEGIAEYVSVQALAPSEQRVGGVALAAAERGVSDLPDDASFNDADSAAHYGLAWWACEYVARSYGRQALWDLLDRLDRAGSTDAEQDQVLRSALGIDRRALARRAARLMVVTFAPEPPAPPPTTPATTAPTPTTTPPTPASPSASPSED
jgi:hypothetical protein